MQPKHRLATISATVFTAAVAAQSPSLITPCHDFRAIDAQMQAVVASAARSGASLSIARDGELLLRRSYGGFDETTQVAIASATKWLSGAVIMALVDDGVLDLDAPVSRYLPQFTGQKGTMTVRQMFSHTSGLPGNDPIISNDRITLAQAVDHIAANVALRAAPGAEFFYGGVSMHVAGRVAEVVSGMDWASLFVAKIAGPLQMNATDYLGLGSASNPRIAGGARSTLGDYENFMAMIQSRGVFRGRRVLSAAAVDTMVQDQTRGAIPVSVPPTLDVFRGYGIGCWMERIDNAGVSLEISSPGAFGFSGFLDLERGTHGVFMVESLNSRTDPYFDLVRALTRDQLRYRGVECYGDSSPACDGRLRLRTNAEPLVGEAGFALLGDHAPASTSGVCLVSPSAALPPLRILGVDLHVPLGPTTIAETVFAAADGSVTLAIPLTTVPAGTLVFAQLVMLPTPNCASPTLLATTHGISIRMD
ncbi:MAG: serine hydrolase domain-containing protein [Planctomycetota bacterium]